VRSLREACAAVATAALVAGCATFSTRPERPVIGPTANPPPVTTLVSERAFLEAGRDNWINWPSAGLADFAASAVTSSGLVRNAQDREPSAVLELSITEHQAQGPGLLTFASALLIPGAVDHRLQVDVKLTDLSGNTAACTRTADSRTWYEMFLIFAYPFGAPSYERIKASEALALQCVAELLQPALRASPG